MSRKKLDNLSMPEVGHRIKTRRLELGLSQSTLAREIGFSDPNTVKNYEKGRVPHLSIIQKLSRVLRVSSGWLITGSEKEKFAGEEKHGFYPDSVRKEKAMFHRMEEIFASDDEEAKEELRRHIKFVAKVVGVRKKKGRS